MLWPSDSLQRPSEKLVQQEVDQLAGGRLAPARTTERFDLSQEGGRVQEAHAVAHRPDIGRRLGRIAEDETALPRGIAVELVVQLLWIRGQVSVATSPVASAIVVETSM